MKGSWSWQHTCEDEEELRRAGSWVSDLTVYCNKVLESKTVPEEWRILVLFPFLRTRRMCRVVEERLKLWGQKGVTAWFHIKLENHRYSICFKNTSEEVQTRSGGAAFGLCGSRENIWWNTERSYDGKCVQGCGGLDAPSFHVLSPITEVPQL